MGIVTLNHAALHVKNAERSAEFYGSYCSMEVIHSRTDADLTVKWMRHPADAFMLVLLETLSELSQEPGNMDHLGFYVANRSDVDAIAQRAKAEGILVEGPVYAGQIVGYYCMIQDPDGYLLEFSCEQLQL